MSDPNDPFCPSLPSSEHAYSLVKGEPKAILGVAGTTLFRAALIGLGIGLMGDRKHLVKNSIAGAVSVEAFVIGWIALKKKMETAA